MCCRGKAAGPAGVGVVWEMAVNRLAKIFKLNKQGFNPVLGLSAVVPVLILDLVLHVLHLEEYFLSVLWALVVQLVSDPGGKHGYRVSYLAGLGVIGALLTALGFGIGGGAWGWVVLAAFAVTLLASLAVRYGRHRFVAALQLNLWFLIALHLPDSFRLGHLPIDAWAQALAWLIGSALFVVTVTVVWLARGRRPPPALLAGTVPGSTQPVPLSRRVIMFAALRAVVVAITVAIAWGLHVQYADWMALSALVAMKPSLAESALKAEQRLAGVTIGAAVAALVLLTVHEVIALGVIIAVLGGLAVSLVGVNYAWYYAAMTGVVLISLDLPHPSDLADEARRVLFTLVGVGIAVLVMFLADLLAKRAPAAVQPAGQAG